MTSTDDPAAVPAGPRLKAELPGGQVQSELVEALVHLLIEKNVLTRNDALSIVGTVAQVTRGRAVEAADGGAQAEADLAMLLRMYGSFAAIADRPAAPLANIGNVHRLRPPIHGGPPEFPHDE